MKKNYNTSAECRLACLLARCRGDHDTLAAPALHLANREYVRLIPINANRA